MNRVEEVFISATWTFNPCMPGEQPVRHRGWNAWLVFVLQKMSFKRPNSLGTAEGESRREGREQDTKIQRDVTSIEKHICTRADFTVSFSLASTIQNPEDTWKSIYHESLPSETRQGRRDNVVGGSHWKGDALFSTCLILFFKSSYLSITTSEEDDRLCYIVFRYQW